ncbi:MAG: VUT family protein [Robiginitomaculum sp.]|nr:VUT family protein [Robiginitomaculum sp.]
MSKLFSIKWTLVYIALIPFVNWSFTWAPNIELFGGWAFNPVTIVTGLVLVVRDFAQREIGHKVLIAMMIALGLTAVLAGPKLALASGAAFAISELVDWSLFTFTKFRLSTRVFLSSLIAAPIDSAVFLLGAGFFTIANLVMSIIGKMVGAIFVALVVRRSENQSQSLQNHQ